MIGNASYMEDELTFRIDTQNELELFTTRNKLKDWDWKDQGEQFTMVYLQGQYIICDSVGILLEYSREEYCSKLVIVRKDSELGRDMYRMLKLGML